MILAAPLGARTRCARLIGVFLAAKPPKKRILIYCKVHQAPFCLSPIDCIYSLSQIDSFVNRLWEEFLFFLILCSTYGDLLIHRSPRSPHLTSVLIEIYQKSRPESYPRRLDLRQYRTILMVQLRRQKFRQGVQNSAGNSRPIGKGFCTP